MKKYIAALIILFVLPVVIAVLFGLLISLIPNISAWTGIKAIYLLMCAPIHIGGIFRLLFPKAKDNAYYFGAGLYYGTILLAGFLRDYIQTSDSNLYIIAGAIVSLVCYIVWLKIKPKE